MKTILTLLTILSSAQALACIDYSGKYQSDYGVKHVKIIEQISCEERRERLYNSRETYLYKDAIIKTDGTVQTVIENRVLKIGHYEADHYYWVSVDLKNGSYVEAREELLTTGDIKIVATRYGIDGSEETQVQLHKKLD